MNTAALVELKTCLEDYQSQGCKLTKKSLKEYIKHSHAASRDLPAQEQEELFQELAGIFLP